MRLFYICILLIAIISCNQQPSVNFSGDLDIGVEIKDSLQKKEVKTYQFRIDSGTFFYGYVDQLTVDVVVKLNDSEGELINSFDGPGRGPENFSFDIEKTGEYTLEVEPFKEESGEYSILISTVEPIAKDPRSRVDQLMWFYSGNTPGAVVGVMENGELIFSKGYGKANLTYDIDFSKNMPTNIGSVSKQFTAMAILLLEKEGKLSLDDDVRKYIPELPDLGEVVKIRNILNHTNGWREVYNLIPITGWKGGDKLLKGEVLRILQRQTEFQASPGEEYNYNNTAFIMAAEIVERISGKDFPVFIKENIFDPLGMENSYVRNDPSTIIPKATQGYSYGEQGFTESGDLDASYGAGGIYTTPSDLAKWMNNFENPEVGGPELVEKLVTPGILNNGDTMSYALGIGVGEYKGLKMYSHGGADIAHRAMLVYFPEIKSGVVTLSNNATFPGSTAYKIADAFFKDYLKEEKKEETEETEETDDLELGENILKRYVGKFKSEQIGMIMEFKLEEGALVAYPTGQSELKLEPTSENSFDYIGVEASIIFSQDEEGKYNKAVHTQGGTDFDFVRIKGFDPSIGELQAFTGRYFSDELETFYTIIVKDSMLVAQHRNVEDIELTPTEKDSFNGSVYFMNEVAFQRNALGKIDAFTVSNGRTKGILFERF